MIQWQAADCESRIATLTGADVLKVESKRIQVLDPSGNHRNVELPAISLSKGLSFVFVNTANAAENLVVRNAAAVTIVTVAQSQVTIVFCDGVSWYAIPTTWTFTGLVLNTPTINGETVTGTETHSGTETHGGAETHNGEVTNTASSLFTAGATAGAVAIRLGKTVTEGYEISVIDEVVTLTNAVKTDLTTQLPAGSIVLCAQGNVDAAVAGDASGDNGLKGVAIGTAADVDLYGKSATNADPVIKNTKFNMIPAAYAVIANATTVSVYAVDNAGAAVTEKFTAGGKVRCRIAYAVPNSLDDAA